MRFVSLDLFNAVATDVILIMHGIGLFMLICRWMVLLFRQRCRLVDPLTSNNGTPPGFPFASNRKLPGNLTELSLRDDRSKFDTSLRIFSGTANPSLSQVQNHHHQLISILLYQIHNIFVQKRINNQFYFFRRGVLVVVAAWPRGHECPLILFLSLTFY